MADPRLNSVHLELPRRQDYRRARQLLLQACGSHTLYGQSLHEDWPACSDKTIQGDESAALSASGCWLTDHKLIYPLQVGYNTVGRSSDNDVVVEDAYISRRHCALVVHSDWTCEIHDTASKNGTFVNGVRITSPTRLEPGDEVRVSEQTFLFMTHPSGAADHDTSQHTLSS